VPSEEEDLMDFLIRNRTIAEDDHDEFEREWEENIKYWLSDQLDREVVEAKPFWRSASVSNSIYPIVEQIHALMTDERPIAYAEKRAGGTKRTADIFTHILENVWKDEKVEYINSKSIKHSEIFGTSIMKTTWDFKDKKRIIPINEELVDSRDFFPDPLAEEIWECRYVFERREVPLADVIDDHPDMFEEIINSDHSDFEGKINRSIRQLVGEPSVFVWECWFKDSTRVVDKEDTVGGPKKVKESKRKYPTGRMVKFIGDLILEDKKNPYPWFPYTKICLVPIPDEFWGLSVVTPLKELQDQRNRLRDLIHDNIASNVNSLFVMTENAVDLDEVVPAPNAVLSLRGEGATFERVQGVQLPPEVFNMEQLISEEMNKVSGINDATFGATVGSSRPGTVRSNFNASITRIREYLRRRNDALEDVGNKMVWIIQKFLSDNVTVEFSDPDSDVSDLQDPENTDMLNEILQTERFEREVQTIEVTLNEKQEGFGDALAQVMEDLGVDAKQARKLLKQKGVVEYKNNLREGSYQYRVGIHPIQQRDQEQLFNFLVQLAQFGMADPAKGVPGLIDFEMLWENVPLPGKEAMVRRLRRQQRKFEAAQQQQIQQEQTNVESGNEIEAAKVQQRTG